VIAPEHLATELRDSLESAATCCRTALADYLAGVLDQGELRESLFRAGVVEHRGEAWLLDLSAGCWWRYDGVGVEVFGDVHVHTDFARLRAVIDELAANDAMP
jgi:hypothetical protein